MRVGINATSATLGGGITYLKNLSRGLAAVGSDHQFVWYVSPQFEMSLVEPHPSFEIRKIDLAAGSVARRLFWELFLLPDQAKRDQLDVLFAPANFIPLRSACPTVVQMQSVEPFVGNRRNSSERLPQLLLKRWLSVRALRRSRRVIFLSGGAQRLVAERYRFDQDKADVIPLGFSEEFSTLRSGAAGLPGPLPKKYLLFVSVFRRHKDVKTLLIAFHQVVRRCPDLRLLLVGPTPDRAYWEECRQLITELDLTGSVIHLGGLSYECMPGVYSGATLFLQPSLYEAFPHTLLEAMASGVPIIGSEESQVPEICGEAALTFRAGDVDRLAAHINRALEDEELRKRMVGTGLERVKRYAWVETARRTLHTLESCLR